MAKPLLGELIHPTPEGALLGLSVVLLAPQPRQGSSNSRGSPPASPFYIHDPPTDNQLPSPELEIQSITSAGSNETSLFGSPIPAGSPGLGNNGLPPADEVTLVYLPHEDPSLFDRPAAVLEKPHIRLAYLAAVASNLINHVKRHSVERTLNITLLAYRTLNAIPDYPKPVTTLDKVYQRLGLDARAFIHKRAMCSKCYPQHFSRD